MVAESTDISQALVWVIVAIAVIYVGFELLVCGSPFVPRPGNGPLFVTVVATTIGFAGTLLVVSGTRWFYRRMCNPSTDRSRSPDLNSVRPFVLPSLIDRPHSPNAGFSFAAGIDRRMRFHRRPPFRD